MRLLFLSQYFPPETGAGATRAESLRRYLSELGWEIDVICETPNYPSGIIEEVYNEGWFHKTKTESGSITRTWVIPTRRESLFQQIVMFGSFMISSFIYGVMNPNNYDAVYATSPPIFGAISGLLLSRIYRVPFFFEVRDLWPDAAVETGHISKLNLLYKISKYLEQWLYRKADLVIPVTHKSEQLIKKTCNQAKTCVVYNGVDIDHFKMVPEARTKVKEPIKEHMFRIGYVGTIGVIHDLDTVIKAAKKLESVKDIEFVIIGDGSRSVHLQQLMDEYQPANVQWLGIKNHKEIPTYLSTLDIALNPVYNTRVFESIITVKFFEYLACEVPVITMANGILKDVGDTSKAAITISPEDTQLLIETILYLKDNPEKRLEMKQHGRDFILQYFDRKNWVGYLSDTLKRELAEVPSPNGQIPSMQDILSASNYKW